MKPSSFFMNLPMRWKLLCWYAGVILMCILIMGAVEYISANRVMTASFMNIIRNDMEQKAMEISSRFNLFERISYSLASDSELSEYLTQPVQTPLDIYDLQVKLEPRLQSIYIANPELYNLTFYLSNPVYKGVGGIIRYLDDQQDQQWYIEAQASMPKVAFWSGMESDPKGWRKDLTPVVSTIQPLYDRYTMKHIGLMKMDFYEELIFQVLDRHLFSDTYIWVEGKDGKRIYTNDDDEFSKLMSVYDREGISPEGLDQANREIMGYLFFSQPIGKTGWRLVSAVPRYHLTLQFKPTILNIIEVSCFCLLILAIISFSIASLFSKRLNKIVERAHRISEGDLKMRLEDNSKDEIGKLALAFNHMCERLEQQIEDNNRTHALQRKAELCALQSQINPHFLYNTLSLVHYLAEDIDAYHISDVVKALIRFFRLSLNRGSDAIKVSDEIEQVRVYLDIQLLHYSGRFKYRIEAEPDILNFEIMKMILQPFVENSIIHGLEGMSEPIEIVVKAKRENKNILFSIEDTGCGIPASVLEQLNDCDGCVPSKGYGISNVQARIKLRYGAKYGVKLSNRAEGGTRVEIEIPIECETGDSSLF